jgi:26S proteasome regulatory subunit N7
MELEFKEPTLQLHTLLKSENSQESLRDHLLRTLNINIYKNCIEKGLLNKFEKDHQKDIENMELKIKEKLKGFEDEKLTDLDNESFIIDVDRKICEFYAQICDCETFSNLAIELTKKDPSVSLKLDILMCKIRIAIILEQRNDLVKSIEDATFLFESSSDWDRKNRFKVYLGLFHLIKAEFLEAANYFGESLSSFDAPEVMTFENLVLYFVFCSLLSFSRSDLKIRCIDNAEVRKCKAYAELPIAMFDCRYSDMLKKLSKFIDFCEIDLFLNLFKEYFCKEMKVKMYFQLLMSYQSLHLTKMAQFFGVEVAHIEDDLRNFITDGKISCVIDRIDGVVRMRNMKKEDDLHSFFKLGAEVLREIKKSIN